MLPTKIGADICCKEKNKTTVYVLHVRQHANTIHMRIDESISNRLRQIMAF